MPEGIKKNVTIFIGGVEYFYQKAFKTPSGHTNHMLAPMNAKSEEDCFFMTSEELARNADDNLNVCEVSDET